MSDDRICYVTPARELLRFELGGERVDVRGWPVLAGDERTIGAVDRLLIEQATGRVRWATVALVSTGAEDSGRALGSILVPIGLIRPRAGHRAIIVDGVTTEQLMRAPRLHRRPVMRSDENAALDAYGIRTASGQGNSLYSNAHFDEERGLCPR